jgi:serine O-acetyltransferase
MAPVAEIVPRLSAADREESDQVLRSLATSGCW